MTPDVPDDMTREEYRATLDDMPADAPGFLARSKKAIAGGIAGLATGGLGSAITAALADGSVDSADLWGVASIALGGFLLGFLTVWNAPANAA
jgi:hypothetical protein